MSYSTQYNNQQKSLGIFIVCALHIILIWALANGLTIEIPKIPIPLHPTKVIEQPITPIPLPIPVEPSLRSTVNNIESIASPLTPIDIVVEPAASISSPIIEPQPKTSSITRPKLQKATKPEYPTAATRLGEEGETGLNLLIGADGRVAEVKLVSSSGSARLDEAAIKHAQRNWRFSPCTEGDKPVTCWFQTKLIWRIEH
ncbi:MAG TPA: energy transducer TonB [Cellvibrio sp.]|nr:energy transducer TonB [Cellvibrio sp.]